MSGSPPSRIRILLLLILLLPGPVLAAFQEAPLGRGGAIAANDPRATAVGLDALRAVSHEQQLAGDRQLSNLLSLRKAA